MTLPFNIRPIHFPLILFVLLGFIGCRNNENDISLNIASAGGNFTILLNDPVETLDPIQIMYISDWHASFLIYEGLIGYGDSLDKLEPLLAESWDILENGLLIRFHLRDDVKFHDNICFPNGRGRKIVADDVVYMMERLADPEKPGYFYRLFNHAVSGMEEYHSGAADSITGITIIDDHTLEFRLKQPFAPFLKLLATPAAYIIPREAVEFYGERFYRHPVGTGPYRLAVWNPLESLTFVKNHKYRGRDSSGTSLPYLDEIVIRCKTEFTVSISELLKGRIHALPLSGNEPDRLLEEPGYEDKFRLYENKLNLGVRFYGIRFDSNSVLSKHKLLRKAIAMSFDRSFIPGDPGSRHIKSNTFIPDELLSVKGIKYYPNNRDAAIRIINDLDLEDTVIHILSSIASPDLEHLESAIGSLGIDVFTDINPKNYYKNIVSGKSDIFRVSMVPSFPDPTDYYAILYSKSPPDLNLMGYSNPEFDAFFEQSLIEQDEDKRRELFMHMERIIYDDVPVLLLSHESGRYYAVTDNVKGFKFRYIFPDYRTIWLSKNDVR